MEFLTDFYGQSEGPLGFPLNDRQAIALESILKALPREPVYAYRKARINSATTETLPGERSDVSWITTEAPDRAGDVVLARGMNDSQFKLNPIVTLQHCYFLPPVGRSLWRKPARDGELKGIKAKTQYPQRPAEWSDDWPADIAFALVQANLLNGKSIGFLPTKVHVPDDKEINQNGWTNKVSLVVDEWILLEYACVFLPAQAEAIVESVSKTMPEITELIQKALAISVKGAIPYRETPKADEGRAWDAAAARERLREWADGDWKKYAQGFAYFEGNGDKAGDYKLPHHDIIGGELKVVFNGVKHALAALHGARGIDMPLSDVDKARVESHLKKHYAQFGKEPPDGKAVDCPFRAVSEIEGAVAAALASIDPLVVSEKAVQNYLDRKRGRI